jgi:membrane protease subunit HflK
MAPNGGWDIVPPEQFSWEDIKRAFKQKFPGFKFNPIYIVIAILALWILSGIYFVGPDEQGVVLRFGKVIATTGSGPHWHFPWPVERVLKPKVTIIRKIEVGFRTVRAGPPARYQQVPTEALMLTGDENIISLEFIVQYRIKDAYKYLFKIREPVNTIKDAAEAAMREVIGQHPIDDALTEKKGVIQDECHQLLQTILDSYNSGLQVVTINLQDVDPPEQVSDAFKDVINAQQDKERKINEAKGYRNDLVPKARGEAAQKINDSQAYREYKIKEAEGDAKRFTQLLKEYQKAKTVTRKRLYLETMEEILPNVEKIILGGPASRNVLPYLPIHEAARRKPGVEKKQ